jgi:hypothetical protein
MHELEFADKLGVASHPTEVGIVNFPDEDFWTTFEGSGIDRELNAEAQGVGLKLEWDNRGR